MRYPADKYDFCTCSQEKDGALLPPMGPGWFLIATNAAEDEDGPIIIATWARAKSTEPVACEDPSP